MTLTPAQQLVIQNYVLATPSLSSKPQTADGAWDIAIALNLSATIACTVWKTKVEVDEIMRNGMDWTQVDNLSVGKARIWDWMTKLGGFNASKINVRAGIDAAWVGTAAMLAVRASIYVHCKRLASQAEKLLATGTGVDPASPATLVYEGNLNYQEVGLAMGWIV